MNKNEQKVCKNAVLIKNITFVEKKCLTYFKLYLKCYIFAPFISIRLGMEFTKRNKFIIIINLNSLL